MKETIVAEYQRKSTLPRYCRSAFAKATEVIGMTCTILDYTEETEMGIVRTVNGVQTPDIVYRIQCRTVKGRGFSYNLNTREEANAQVKVWLKSPGGFARVR